MNNSVRRTADIYTEGEYGEFVIRKDHPPFWKLALLFLTCFVALYIVASNPAAMGGSFGIALAIFAVIGPLSWFTIYLNQRNRDMVLAAEFQNALFSAAARLKSKFCMIVKQDGTIFYYDRGFQRVFPETANRGMLMLDKIFSAKHISMQEAQKLDHALEHTHSETVIIHLGEDEHGEPQKIIITVDPIPRPAGFFILRGRDYVVKQYDRISASESGVVDKIQFVQDPKTSATLSHMLQTLPIGLYATDAEGKVLFMNYRLESWLGYAQTEVTARGMALQDMLLPQQNTLTAEALFLKNCEGLVIFTTKDGRGIKLFVRQEISLSETGASIGTVAIVQRPDPNQLKEEEEAAAAALPPRRLFPFSGPPF